VLHDERNQQRGRSRKVALLDECGTVVAEPIKPEIDEAIGQWSKRREVSDLPERVAAPQRRSGLGQLDGAGGLSQRASLPRGADERVELGRIDARRIDGEAIPVGGGHDALA
jgi:hypothetical protein